ncbi:cobalamin-binding protein [Pseudonocardiaceae bacterium YIM PH 21723]|nr:cobalamin-binding protein [Pseudonocardiaceae bacterium YIM PH 21723]
MIVRVVSLVPSLTEVLATSVPGALVGITDYCTHPELDLPRVGGSKYPDLAKVLATRPELVVVNEEENRESDVDALRAAGIRVWVTPAPATVPHALDGIEELLTVVFGLSTPDWLVQARRLWARPREQWATAVVPVWRKPWIVLGRDTFAGDVLHRLGVANAFAWHPERYPRPPLAELTTAGADLVVLPSEPYEFTPEDGPQCFPELPSRLVDGRLLTWHGPSLVAAHAVLTDQLRVS